MTAYEMRISDWSSDVCASDLTCRRGRRSDSCREPDRRSPASCGAAVSGATEEIDDEVGADSGVGGNVDRLLVLKHGVLAIKKLECPLLVAIDLHRELPDLGRSEEHKSELQYLMRSSYAVFCLKKKK